MKRLFLDEITKSEAMAFADREADLHGYARGSADWKRCFKKYLGEAAGGMTLGRNPRKNPREIQNWPEIFGREGFAGEVAQNYKGQAVKGMSLEEVRSRIQGAVSNLVYMWLNGIYGIRTTTIGRQQGKIPAENMSDLQLRGSDEGLTKEEAIAQNKDVLYNQLAMTVIESAVLELLTPFFRMSKSDMDSILDGIAIQGEMTPNDVAKVRDGVERKLRQIMGPKLRQVSVKKLVLD